MLTQTLYIDLGFFVDRWQAEAFGKSGFFVFLLISI